MWNRLPECWFFPVTSGNCQLYCLRWQVFQRCLCLSAHLHLKIMVITNDGPENENSLEWLLYFSLWKKRLSSGGFDPGLAVDGKLSLFFGHYNKWSLLIYRIQYYPIFNYDFVLYFMLTLDQWITLLHFILRIHKQELLSFSTLGHIWPIKQKLENVFFEPLFGLSVVV